MIQKLMKMFGYTKTSVVENLKAQIAVLKVKEPEFTLDFIAYESLLSYNCELEQRIAELDTAARKFRELLLKAEARIAELEAKIEELEKVNKNCNEIIFQHLEPKIRQLETQLAEAQQKIEPQEKALTHYISEFGLTKEAYEILGPWVSPQQPKSEGKTITFTNGNMINTNKIKEEDKLVGGHPSNITYILQNRTWKDIK